MITAAAFICWFAEICLEAIGSTRAYRYRRQIPALYAFLSLAWMSDFACLRFYSSSAYPWLSWFDYMGHWLFLLVLGCQACAKLLGERKTIAWAAASICTVAGALNFFLWSQGDALKDKLLNGAAASDSMLLLVIALAWIAKRSNLDAQWRWIALGIVTQIGWDLLCSVAWGYWDGARHLLPVGEISALLMWNYAVRAELTEVALPLGHRVIADKCGRVQ